MAWQTLYVTIGNSDDTLTQKRWADYIREVDSALEEWGQHRWGVWHSAPDKPFQSACWGIEVEDATGELQALRMDLDVIRERFHQKSIAFATADVHMIEERDG